MTALSRQSLAQLAKEATALSEWTKVRDWAAQIYGEGKAAEIDIDTYGEYNDEGGTNYYIEGITATDQEGNELEPDYSLPFFQTKAWRGNEEEERDEDEDEEGFMTKIKELYMSEEEQATFVDFDDLPREDAIYDLTEEPTLSLLTQEAPCKH